MARNKLSSLEGVEALGSLVSLNASFNRISSLDEVSRLVKLRSLSELDLRLNPITRTSGYRQRVLALLPTLSVLDGRATGVPQVARSVAPLSPTSSPTPDPQLEYSRDSTEAFQSPLSPISRSAEDVGGGPGGDRDHTGGDGARRWPESRVPSNDRAAVARDMDVAERLSYISVSGDEDSAGAVGMLGGGEPKGLRSGEDRVGRRRRRRVDDGRDTGVMMNMNKDRNGDGDGDGNGDEHEPHHHAGAGSTIRDLSRLTGLRGEALSTMASRLLQDPDLQRLATARTATVAEAGSVDGVLHRLRREADTAQLPPGFHRTLTLSLDQVKDLLAKERQDHASECARLRSDRADCRHLASIARTRTVRVCVVIAWYCPCWWRARRLSCGLVGCDGTAWCLPVVVARLLPVPVSL